MLVSLGPTEGRYMSFKVGETVVYPHHGAALIEDIETRIIKGVEKTYLVLKVAQGDLTVRVPAEKVDLVGVRDVVDSAGLVGAIGDCTESAATSRACESRKES